MYCGKCGSKIDDDALFCPVCGSEIKISGNSDNHENQQPKKNNCKKYLLIGIFLIVIIVVGVLYATVGLNTKKEKQITKIERADIPEFNQQKAQAVHKWNRCGIVDISGKKAVISDLQKIGNNIDKFNEYSNCIKELQDNKENYKLDEESYAKYVKALNQCQKAITDKKAQDTFDKYNKVETARTTLINADNKYIKDRVSMYQAIDMANAESSEKKAYK